MHKLASKKLVFTKMQALGNDFIVLDGTKRKFDLSPNVVQKLADRHLGIGCDQILLIEPPQKAKTDFYYRIFNADGSEVGQCGNGARCVALFAKKRGLTSKNKIIFQTRERTIECRTLKGNVVKVNMGNPEQNPNKIPFLAKKKKIVYTLSTSDRKFKVCPLSMGNPHCVLWVKKLAFFDVQKVGAVLTEHACFPEKTNVGFTQIIDRNTMNLRVFERGVGETLACGSAACAAMAASKLLNLVDNQVNVKMQGGTLIVEWNGETEPVWLTGPAEFVFNGEFYL